MKNDLEVNKIFAALLVAGIIAMLAGFVAKQVVASEHLEKDAVPIEVTENAGSGEAAKAAGPDPILALLAAADVARGEKAAKACAACHSFDKGGKNGVGPNLWGVVGRKKDSHEGFAYSGALAAAGGGTWTYDDLNKFLWKPKAYASGTKMGFVGIKNTDDRAAVIAWLRTLADSPMALPSAAEIAAETPEPTPATEEGAKAEPAPEAAHNEKPAEH